MALSTLQAGSRHLAQVKRGLPCLHQLWLQSGIATDSQPTTYAPESRPPFAIVHKDGLDIIRDPRYNKGTAFPVSERDRLGLRGLLPTKVLSTEQQVSRLMEDYTFGKDYIDPVHVKDQGVTREHVRRWKVLQELQDRNQTLFYRVLLDNFTEMAPIIYTPTVGWACLNYHKLYRRPQGMYFSVNDRSQMASMVWNWPAQHVDAIVVTDGSRILGLGDLGINGIGIPIGKLDLYVAAAGFNPARTLPVVLDVGTNNQGLRQDPLYAGLDHPRITGKGYYSLLDEFVGAVTSRWPDAVLQFEDFATEHALSLLHRYKDHHLVFNDDIQGTAATALAGIYGALAVQFKAASTIAEQRVVVLGAGSAGMGVTLMLAQAAAKHGNKSLEDAAKNFWILDAEGLITEGRGAKRLPAVVQPFARNGPEDREGETLLEVVKRVKPTILIGLAGAGRLFTEDVLRTAGEGCDRPIIFPMSNPTSRLECTSEQAAAATDGRAIFAAGSPQPHVTMPDGRVISSSQANNMYIFPGLAFGAHLGQTRVISDAMLIAAAEALPSLIKPEDLARGAVYPDLSDIRNISLRIAAAVIKTAAAEGHLDNPKAQAALADGDERLLAFIQGQMYTPLYPSLIRLPTGVME